MNGFATSVIQGSAWMIGARWTMRAIGLISTVILARLLLPEDFGIIAMAMIVVGFLETIADGGVEHALMRERATSRDHYDTAWTVQIIQGIFVAVLLLLLAPLTASYFDEPRARAVMQVLALRAVAGGLQNIGVVAFRKELDFAKEFRFLLYSKLLNFFVLVGAAFWFRNYWAMAVALVVGSFITVGLSYAMHPYRPRLSLARVKEIWSFSQWLIIARTGSFFSQRCDGFIVGGAMGTSAMGSYHVASELSSIPTSEFVMPIRRALYPTLTSLGDNQAAFNAAVLSSFSAIAVVCFAFGFGLLAVAREVVHLFLGSTWVAVIPLMQLLAVRGCFSALVLVLELPLWARGRTRLSAVPTWLELALLVPAVIIMTDLYGVVGAAAARVAIALVILPVMILLVAQLGWLTVRDLGAQIWRPWVAGSTMAIAILYFPLPEMPLVASLVCKVIAGAIVYAVVLGILWITAGRPETFEGVVWRSIRGWVSLRRDVS